MARGSKIRHGGLRAYIISLGIIVLIFAMAGFLIINSVKKSLTKHMIEDANKLADNYTSTLTTCTTASKTIDELIDEKLIVAQNVVSNHRGQLSNSFLREVCGELGIDEIFWYNSSGKIIYSSDYRYIGWQAAKGHPVYDFMESGKNSLIEPIRADTKSDIYYKYGYTRTDNGEFIQVGILASRIWALHCKFSVQNFISDTIDEDNILDIYFLNNNHEIISSSDVTKFGKFSLDDMERRAIERSEVYSVRKQDTNVETYNIFLPIYAKGTKMGTLILIYSLENVNNMIKKISLLILALLLFLFIVHGYMAMTIISKNKKIDQLAFYDPLTKFLNLNYFIGFLEELLKEDRHDKRALIIGGCSNLRLAKLIYGRENLDRLIAEKADQIRGLGVKAEHLFRYSEDSFCLYIDNYEDEAELIELCKQILGALDIPIMQIEGNRSVLSRVGALGLDCSYKSIDDVIKRIDIMMDRMKGLEDTRYCIFDESIHEEVVFEEKIEVELRKATQRGYDREFYLEYQPQVDLKTDKIIGLEVLARWHSKELGQVSPLKFIDIAERSHLIIPLGEWILKEACKFIKKLEDRGYEGISVGVNISVIQLLQDNFIKKLMEIIQEIGIEPMHLGIEVTETSLISNFETVNKKLNILRNRGISIYLDDFGTGYSSLARLKKLNIDIIKIDKSFIDNVAGADKYEVFINTIISLADELGLKVVAEGVETWEQRQYLEQNNCDMMQGYLFSRPIPEEEVVNLLENTK